MTQDPNALFDVRRGSSRRRYDVPALTGPKSGELLSFAPQQPGPTTHILRWPEPGDVRVDLHSLEADIAALDRRIRRPYDSFGLELKLQYALEIASAGVQTRKALYRVAQEPVILSCWERIKTFGFTDDGVVQFSSLLNGATSPARFGVMWSNGKDGVRTIFESKERARRWIDDIYWIRANAYSPLLESILIYSRIVFAHPLSDGNGRLSRALFYSGLARSGVLRSPCLALGPGLDMHRYRLIEATIRLSEAGDWPAYVEDVADLVAYCVKQVTGLL